MSQSRIDAFEAMVKESPDEALVWYGLASEYSKLGRWVEAAAALRQVIRCNPDYTAAYQMLGTALMQEGLNEEARRAWTEGIAAAARTGTWKAGQHMEGLLAQAGAADQSEAQGEDQGPDRREDRGADKGPDFCS